MPLYEYQCETDGSVIELMRPMSDADKPVKDPDGKGRRFVRKLSTFAAKSGGHSAPAMQGGCCPCGKNQGGCGGIS